MEVTPPLSKALRYSIATDLRCSSVMVWVATCHGLLSDVRRSAPLSAGRSRVPRLGGEVGEGDDRAERGAARPVGARRGRGDAVADAVEAGDRLADVVEHLAVGVGARAALGVEVAAGEQRGVVGALAADRIHGRVVAAGLLLDGAVEEQLDLALAAVEVVVLARLGEAVEARDAGLQRRQEPVGEPMLPMRAATRLRRASDVGGQLLQRLALDDMGVVGARAGR